MLNRNDFNLILPNHEFVAKQLLNSQASVYDIYVFEGYQLWLELY